MTEEEANKYMNQLVYISASGTKEGKQQVRIVDYDSKETSPWGKGTVTVEFPDEPNRGQIKQSLNQIEILNEYKKRKVRRRRTS